MYNIAHVPHSLYIHVDPIVSIEYLLQCGIKYGPLKSWVLRVELLCLASLHVPMHLICQFHAASSLWGNDRNRQRPLLHCDETMKLSNCLDHQVVATAL